MVNINDDITVDPEIMGGIPVFAGTRVPISTLLENIEAGVSLDEFLHNFPTVTREQVERVLREHEFHADLASANRVMRDDANVLRRLANS